MRITNLQLDKEEIEQIEALTDDVTAANKDITLAYDFSKDAYALFKEKVSKRRIIKSYWSIFKDVRNQYARFKMMDLMKNVDFYGRVRNFFRAFIISNLFHELDKLDPIDALDAFLHMFQPPQQQQQQQQSQSQQDQKDNEDQKQEGNSGGGQPKKSTQHQDQKGNSADEANLPIDMTEFKQQLPKIEKIIESGIFDKDDFQEYLGKKAGIGHTELKIGNISEIIKRISQRLSERELEIFYVARKKEATELYRRDEVLESSLCPEDEMTVKMIDNPMEILKVLPMQYAFDDELFMQKLIKHDLLIREYQTRRLKRQALYLLIDVSGSMSGMKNVYACGVALAFVRQAVEEGSTYYLRFFDSRPHELNMVTTKQDAERICGILIQQPFSGGGTKIQEAIRQAVEDITEAPDKFEKAEIMVISDGEDDVDLAKSALKDVKVHSTIIDGHNKGLKLISETYTDLKSNELK